ncbi:MAG: hypothetical protein AAB490_02235 [Patescibacteria group bacterium]
MSTKNLHFAENIDDLSVTAAVLFGTGFFLEMLKPGLITSVIDLTTLFFLASCVLIANLVFVQGVPALQLWQRRYVLIFFGINLFLSGLAITLQTPSHLLGFTLSVLIIAVYILIAYVVRDSGSAD